MALFKRPGTATDDGDTPAPARRGLSSGPKAPRVDPRDPLGGVNSRTKKRQGVILAGVASIIAIGGLTYVYSGSDPKAVKNDPTQPLVTKIATDDMVGKNMADKAWRAQAEVLQSEQSQRLKTVEGEVPKVQSMQQQIADLQQQNAAMKANGEKVLQVMDADSKAKSAQIAAMLIGRPRIEPELSMSSVTTVSRNSVSRSTL